MLTIGLTGGIGSGKTTVAKLFGVLGIPVYYADDNAKSLMNEDESLKEKIQEAFGKDVYRDGRLDRKKMAAIVFNDPAKLERLNALVHPATLAHAAHWMQQQTSPYAIKEAALIFESGAQRMLDYVIGVYAPVSLRIQRTMQRDGITRDAILAIMNKQISEEIKMRLCDIVIINDGQQLLIPQVIAVHEKLMAITIR